MTECEIVGYAQMMEEARNLLDSFCDKLALENNEKRDKLENNYINHLTRYLEKISDAAMMACNRQNELKQHIESFKKTTETTNILPQQMQQHYVDEPTNVNISGNICKNIEKAQNIVSKNLFGKFINHLKQNTQIAGIIDLTKYKNNVNKDNQTATEHTHAAHTHTRTDAHPHSGQSQSHSHATNNVETKMNDAQMMEEARNLLDSFCDNLHHKNNQKRSELENNYMNHLAIYLEKLCDTAMMVCNRQNELNELKEPIESFKSANEITHNYYALTLNISQQLQQYKSMLHVDESTNVNIEKAQTIVAKFMDHLKQKPQIAGIVDLTKHTKQNESNKNNVNKHKQEQEAQSTEMDVDFDMTGFPNIFGDTNKDQSNHNAASEHTDATHIHTPHSHSPQSQSRSHVVDPSVLALRKDLLDGYKEDDLLDGVYCTGIVDILNGYKEDDLLDSDNDAKIIHQIINFESI
eukprot:99642_1